MACSQEMALEKLIQFSVNFCESKYVASHSTNRTSVGDSADIFVRCLIAIKSFKVK